MFGKLKLSSLINIAGAITFLLLFGDNLWHGDNTMNIKFEAIVDYIPFIISGAGLTLTIAFIASITGVILGTVLAIMGDTEGFFKTLSKGYIDLFRGTPLLLQLFFIYFALPQIFGLKMDPFVSALLAFSLNSGAYSSEIIRAGIESVDKGEVEAAYCLGAKKHQVYRDIIIPQAFRTIFPALVNELIVLVKESSIVFAIGLKEIMTRYKLVSSATYRAFEPLLVAAILYYFLILAISKVGIRIERRMKYDNR